MSDGTTILFGLPGVEVREVHRVASGRVAQVVRQRRSTAPRDLGYGEEPLAVRWHKRQYRCGEEACPRTAFTECIPELPAGARVTGRLRRAAAAVVEGGASVAAAVRAHRVSWPVVHAAYVARADAVLTEPAPVQVLGIDETRRGRPRWSRDLATAGGCGRSRSRRTSSTWLVRVACSDRPLGAPWPRSLAGWRLAGRSGRPACRSWPWTRARRTGGRSATRCRRPGSSRTTSIWSGWPTRR